MPRASPAAVVLALAAGCASTAPAALVYRGPAGCDGCSEAVGALLLASPAGYEVHYVGPQDEALTADLLDNAVLYAQPGGNGTVEDAFAYVADDADQLRTWVAGGGHYAGFCMGGYFAGSDPGFAFLDGNSDEYITQPDAEVTGEEDTLVHVTWGDEDRVLYFQDGPYFWLNDESSAQLLAWYDYGAQVAAMVVPYGNGRVGVVGPHPEATRAWYEDAGIDDPDGQDTDLGLQLLATLVNEDAG